MDVLFQFKNYGDCTLFPKNRIGTEHVGESASWYVKRHVIIDQNGQNNVTVTKV